MEPISRHLLTFLLNATWQIPLAAAIAAVACRMMPNGPARHRHAVWVASLGIALLLPLASLRTHPAAPLPSVKVSTSRPAPAPRTVALSWSAARFLLAAYLLFLAYRAVRLVWALFHTWTLRREALPVMRSPAMDAAIHRCREAFPLNGVRVLASERVAGPVAAGAVILPESMLAETSPDVLATAIGHEMAHIARHDFTCKLVYELLSLPIAFHPVTAFIRREIERTREMACDELVTARLLDAGVYARSIVAIAGAIGPLRPSVMPGVFDGDILEERIRRLVERRDPRHGLRRARLALAGGLSALALLVAAASGLAVSALARARPSPR